MSAFDTDRRTGDGVHVARVPIVGAWVTLMALTLLGWWLGRYHGLGTGRWLTAVILIVTFIKVFLVGYVFMDLRHTPRPILLAFASGCFVVCMVLIALANIL
ncbi:hypothetical protein GCM10022267_89260 [Lentzea roselyniae]|uniref:Cytochrome C oxidase subunit IV n=1 Tax=Lentzea roselyniae TaxID=531940 RepID=A0ABP7CIE1_9PSEU